MKEITVAICYDFDKTLTTTNMQEFSFIPNLGMTPSQFWKICNDFSRKTKMDSTLGYLKCMIDTCEAKDIKLTKEYLNSLGKDIKYFNGVETWFSRINRIASKLGINLEHYIISTGNTEIIEGTPIYKEFKDVYGCEFHYDQDGVAFWPKNIVNFTMKTQYLFRICKGANDKSDEQTINKRIKNKHVEFRNMIYLGDGITDIPCMTLVKEKGGTAISIYDEDKKSIAQELIDENRVNYACKGDYSKGSELEKLITLILESIVLKEKLIQKENSQKGNN